MTFLDKIARRSCLLAEGRDHRWLMDTTGSREAEVNGFENK